MEILPIDDPVGHRSKNLAIEIAFVRTGMDAVVKIDAYDYTIFGDLSGTLTYLSADTLVDNSDSGAVPYYRAQVTTTGDRFSKQDHSRARDPSRNDRDGRDQDRQEYGFQLSDQATGQDCVGVLHRSLGREYTP